MLMLMKEKKKKKKLTKWILIKRMKNVNKFKIAFLINKRLLYIYWLQANFIKNNVKSVKKKSLELRKNVSLT